MSRLTLADIERARATPGASVLLFITDRCPVGCAHCSVDSRVDSPTITDFERFDAVLDGICDAPRVGVVGISGGEPFVERRGLTHAVDRLTDAGKQVVPHTSGVWAKGASPQWVRAVLRKSSCVILSTDAFHADAIADETFVRAAQTIAEEGAWIVVQVLGVEAMVERAGELLDAAFGDRRSDLVELNLTPLLPYGRGNVLFRSRPTRRGDSFGACKVLNASVIRYDGTMSACCNEQVIMGGGPERLREHPGTGHELRVALDAFETDPLFNAIATVGVGALTAHPEFGDLAAREFSSICEICWEMQRRVTNESVRSDRLLTAMAAMTGAPT